MHARDRASAFRRRAAGALAAAGLLSLGLAPAGAAPSQTVPLPTARVTDSTLTVTGTAAADRIRVGVGPGELATVVLDLDGDDRGDQQFDRSAFNRIVVRAGGGDDAVRFDEFAAIILDELITLDGGGGNDTLTGGVGVETLIGGTGNDVVDGDGGDDNVDLGPGQDTFAWSPGDRNDDVEGGDGTDTVDMTTSGANDVIGLTSNTGRVQLTRDVGSVTLDVGDVERITLATFGGTDTVNLTDMAGTDVQRIDVDLSAAAGGGDSASDTVRVTGTVDASRAGVATVAGRLEIEGLVTAIGVDGDETIDRLEVTGRTGPNVDVADGMTVSFDLRHRGFSHDGS